MNKIFVFSLIMLGSVFISSCSQILLKKAALQQYSKFIDEYLNPTVILAYIIFFISTLVTVFALKHVPLSSAPIIESSGYVFVSILEYIFLKEKIGRKKIIGMCIIIVGICIFSL